MSSKRRPPVGNVRQVRSTGQNIRGVITNKVGRLVQFESWAERALILQLDRDPEVLDYGSQPETFEFIDEQRKVRHYTPDFIVWRRSGEVEIHEVTLSRRRLRPDSRRREEAAEQICQARGWQYIVHTEQTLPQGSELANLLTLAGYRPTSYANEAVTQAAVAQLGSGQRMALERLVQQMGSDLNLAQGQVTAALGHLLWSGELLTDFNQLLFDEGAINPDITVWLEAGRLAQ